MRLTKDTALDWRQWDPRSLSDEQAEFLYAKAKQLARDVEDFPRGSMGRMVAAAYFLTLVQEYDRRTRS